MYIMFEPNWFFRSGGNFVGKLNTMGVKMYRYKQIQMQGLITVIFNNKHHGVLHDCLISLHVATLKDMKMFTLVRLYNYSGYFPFSIPKRIGDATQNVSKAISNADKLILKN